MLTLPQLILIQMEIAQAASGWLVATADSRIMSELIK